MGEGIANGRVPQPRIAPGTRSELGLLNSGIASVIGRATGGAPPRVFTTLGKHRRLFRAWLRFASRLMPRGTLSRTDTELLILRVAHGCGSEYEWRQHERIGLQAGLSVGQIANIRVGPEAEGWTPHQAALLRAADELHSERCIADETWASLAADLTENQLTELCMLVGHYEMLAMTLNSLGVVPDELPDKPGLASRLLSRSLSCVAVALVIACSALALGSTPARAATPKLRSGNGLKVLEQEDLSPRLVSASLQTDALPTPPNLQILLPSGYGAHPNRRYPVLYLFHGTSGYASDWTTSGDARKTTAGKPLIVVMPDIDLNGDGGGWCADWPSGQYKWETFHIHQLVPFVDRNLRTIRNRKGRAIAGLSQGGFCATSYASRHPGLFSAAFSFSGAPDIAYDTVAQVGSSAIINATEVGLDGVPPNSIFGDRVTNEVNWAAHDPATLAENLRNTRLYMYTGDGTPGPYDSVNPVDIPGYLGSAGIEALVHQDTIYFHDRLNSLGIPSYFNDYGGGTHTWGYWARDLRWSIGQIMHAFRDPLGHPTRVNYTSAENLYSVYHWRVQTHRDAREFSTLSHAHCHGFTLAGSGSATVRTPPCLRPRTRYRVALSGDAGASKLAKRSNGAGRLRIPVTLGASNPYQQYTVEADVAGTAVYSTKVRLRRVMGRK